MTRLTSARTSDEERKSPWARPDAVSNGPGWAVRGPDDTRYKSNLPGQSEANAYHTHIRTRHRHREKATVQITCCNENFWHSLRFVAKPGLVHETLKVEKPKPRRLVARHMHRHKVLNVPDAVGTALYLEI